MDFMNSVVENAGSSVVIGASLTDWVGGMLTSFKTIISTALILIGLVVGVMIIAKNPTIGRVITGIAVGAFIGGLPWIMPMVGEMFRGDLSSSSYHMVLENEMQAFSILDFSNSHNTLS